MFNYINIQLIEWLKDSIGFTQSHSIVWYSSTFKYESPIPLFHLFSMQDSRTPEHTFLLT